MKTIFTFLFSCLVLCGTAQAQITVWTGATSTNAWGTSANWSNGVPGSTKSAILRVVSNGVYPLITASSACLNLTMRPGANLTISSGSAKLDVYGAAAIRGTVTVNASSSASDGLIVRGAVALDSSATIALNGRMEVRGNFTNNNSTVSSGDDGLLLFTNTTANILSGNGAWSLADVTFSNAANNVFDSSMPATWPVKIRRVATVRSGNVTFNGKVWLTSDAASISGMIYNVPGVTMGTMTGDVRVERAIDPSFNNGTGYRHYSTPVAATTIADLDNFTSGVFTASVQPAYAYNAPAPNGTPSATVYNYNQALVTPTNNAFEYGWHDLWANRLQC